MSVVSYAEVQQAIARCVSAHPSTGKDLVLHRDASLLCDILGEMIYRRLDEIQASVIQGEHLVAFQRWRVQPAPDGLAKS